MVPSDSAEHGPFTSFPMEEMVLFHSYVCLPEGITHTWDDVLRFVPADNLVVGEMIMGYVTVIYVTSKSWI